MSDGVKKKNRKEQVGRPGKGRIVVSLAVCIFLLLAGAFLVYTGSYYRADDRTMKALVTDETAEVSEEDYGYFFDGPSEDKVLIFYPGAKVEDKAYAPLLREIAEKAMDVCLVHMPFHLAVFGIDKAAEVMEQYNYPEVYVGGHSLGGAMAASYAADNPKDLEGVILFAAYPTKKTAVDTLLIYGSEDGVLSMSRAEEAEALVSGVYEAYCIAGGNHAQFGDYGEQSGDGKAGITAGEQQRMTIEKIGTFLKNISTRP